MYELNGQQYSLEEVQAAADQSNLSLQEYIAKANIKMLDPVGPDFQLPTTPGAVVEETVAPDMDSTSDPGSSVSLENKAGILGSAFKTLIGAADETKVGKFAIRKAKTPISLGKSLYKFFAENTAEAFVGLNETFLKNSQNIVDKFYDTPEKKETLLDYATEQFFDPLLDVTRAGGKILEDIDKGVDDVTLQDSSTTATEDLLSGNITDASNKIADGVIEALPSVAAAIYGGPIGFATIFASSAGGAYKQKIDVDSSKRGDIGTYGLSLLQGGVEVTSELITRGLVKGFGGTVLERAAPNAAKNLYKNLTKNLTGRIFTGANLEGISENVAQETNRAIDAFWDEENAFGYKKENPDGSVSYDWGNILYRFADTYMISGIIGGAIGAKGGRSKLANITQNPQSKAYVEERLTPSEIKKENLKAVNQISKLEKQYENSPNDLILDEILELQKKVTDNKILNEKVLNSFDDAELEQYAIGKVNVANARQGLKNIEDASTKDLLEKTIEKQEKALNKQYNEQKAIILMLNFGPNVTNTEVKQKVQENKNKKVSDEVQKIYDEKGVEGAFEILEKFKPITNNLVRKRREAPNYDEQLLRDEIETGERGILDLIRDYKPDSGTPLAGYINKFLPARAIEASKRVLGEQFTQDVTEIRESRIDIDDTTQEVLDFVRTEPKAKEQLRDIAGITKESVQKDATQILKGKLPGIIEKSGRDKNEILTAINKASDFKIADAVLEEMGGNFNNKQEQNSRFTTFMDVNYDAIIKAIPNSVKNKLALFEAKQVGRETMQEGDQAGKGVFEYKTPTKQEFINFYTEGKLNGLRAKKKRLAGVLAQEIGKDAIAEVLADPNVQKEFLERQELQGKEIPEGAIPKLLQRIDRYIDSIDTKDPGILAFGISPVLIKRAFKAGLKVFRATLKKTNDFQKSLSAFVKEVKTYFKSKEEGKIAEEVIRENVTVDNIESLDLDTMIDEVAEKVNIDRGKAYERVIYTNAEGVKNPIFKIKGEQTEKGNAPDIQFEIAGQVFNIEAKLKGAQYTSWTINDVDFNSGKVTIKKKTGLPKKVIEKIESLDFKGFQKLAAKYGITMNSIKDPIPKDVYQKIKNDGGLRLISFDDKTGGLGLNFRNIGEVYDAKGVNDIQLKDLGLFNMGKNNRFNLFDISKQPLNAYIRPVPITIKGGPNAGQYQLTYRVLPQAIKDRTFDIKKSNYSIDTANGINKLLKSDAVLDLIAKQKSIEKYNSKDLNKDFNNFLEKATGIGAQKVFSEAKAIARGKQKRKVFGDYFIPPGAEDFGGLMHRTLAKGKIGEQQLKFYKENLYDPFNAANESITRERRALTDDFRALKKKLSNVPNKLKNLTSGGDFTISNAVRAYIWNKQGMKIPGLSETDLQALINEVQNDSELLDFSNQLINITKSDGYVKPENNWLSGNIATDLMALFNASKRSKHLEVWQNNVDQIFTKENLNKLEAAYGKNYRVNLEKTLERMKTGMNRKWGGDKTIQAYLDWVNGSVGAIMFLNTRSAVLQTISNINYINFKDNNPLLAAKAYANQPQFWKDFKTIFNSDYLQERRGGNQINVNENELAQAAEKGGVQGTISLLLNKGFIFTKIADSFAIASGGAPMYRNRINTYIKQGLSQKEAEDKAFLDFKAITEETQQSSRPDRISEQQASNAGRLLLAFANTPMQYNRIIKRNAQDLVDGRGDPKEKVTKIIYYSTIQNLLFNAMQKALFALAFAGEDEDEKEIEKYSQVASGMADSLLRGSGLTGNAVVAVKNIAFDIADRAKRPRPNFQDAAWKALTISPPLHNKASKLRGAGYSLGYVTPENVFEPKLDNPALSAGANIISATTNVPLDRALRKAQNIEAAMSDEAEWWQTTALLMGWGTWELGMENEKDKKEKQVRGTNIRASNRKPIKREKQRKTF